MMATDVKPTQVLFLEFNLGEVAIHLSVDSIGHFEGSVYPITRWTGQNSTSGFSYNSAKSSDLVDTIEEARNYFDFSFCWRGVWEGRIYFKDDEYWSEELQSMAEIWAKLEVELKKRIRATRPTEKLDD